MDTLYAKWFIESNADNVVILGFSISIQVKLPVIRHDNKFKIGHVWWGYCMLEMSERGD